MPLIYDLIFYISSGYLMNLLIDNKFNTIIINETNNLIIQINPSIKIRQNLKPFIKSIKHKRHKIKKFRQKSFHFPKKFRISVQREEKKF